MSLNLCSRGKIPVVGNKATCPDCAKSWTVNENYRSPFIEVASHNRERHPVQTPLGARRQGMVPALVSLAAYEVYRHLYGPQEALVTGDCRGGFGANELVAFLYARSFPQNEWRARVAEAFAGMENL